MVTENLSLHHARHFRPSDGSPVRFGLWIVFVSIGVALIVFVPRVPFLAAFMFVFLGQIAGSQPTEPDRALKPKVFLASVLTAGLFLAFFAFVFGTQPGSGQAQSPVTPSWARTLVAVLYATAILVETRRFSMRRHRVAAA